MKSLIHASLLLFSSIVFAQKEIKPSDEFVITGALKQELKFSVSDLEKLESVKINDIEITNHLGEKRNVAKNLKGFPIRNLLNKIEFKVESPKELNEFYLTFISTDNYKVVYSWNEIFNTVTGNNIFVITEKEGKRLSEMNERILVMTSTDFKTGRRNIKGLSKIVVARAQ